MFFRAFTPITDKPIAPMRNFIPLLLSDCRTSKFLSFDSSHPPCAYLCSEIRYQGGY